MKVRFVHLFKRTFRLSFLSLLKRKRKRKGQETPTLRRRPDAAELASGLVIVNIAA